MSPEEKKLVIVIVELLTVVLGDLEGIEPSIDSRGWKRAREDLYDAAERAGMIE